MSINIITSTNLNLGIVTQDKCQKVTLSQLQIETSDLDKYWQEIAESKRKEELYTLTQKIEAGIQELTVIAEKINSLANDIKALMFCFKEIAVKVNRDYHLIQQTFNLSLTKLDKSKRRLRPLNIWEIHDSSIPTVIRRGAKFILTKTTVNLFHP